MPQTFSLAACVAMALLCTSALAHAEAPKQYLVPQSMLPQSIPPKPVAGLTDLKFNELFKMPVGAKGLEVTQKAHELSGKRVRMIGYMIEAQPATPGIFALSPVPEEMGDSDEKLADDFPPNVVFVHFSDATLAVPHIDGLIQLVGTLEVGSFEEPDDHISTFRMHLDANTEKELKHALNTVSASK